MLKSVYNSKSVKLNILGVTFNVVALLYFSITHKLWVLSTKVEYFRPTFQQHKSLQSRRQ